MQRETQRSRGLGCNMTTGVQAIIICTGYKNIYWLFRLGSIRNYVIYEINNHMQELTARIVWYDLWMMFVNVVILLSVKYFLGRNHQAHIVDIFPFTLLQWTEV